MNPSHRTGRQIKVKEYKEARDSGKLIKSSTYTAHKNSRRYHQHSYTCLDTIIRTTPKQTGANLICKIRSGRVLSTFKVNNGLKQCDDIVYIHCTKTDLQISSKYKIMCICFINSFYTAWHFTLPFSYVLLISKEHSFHTFSNQLLKLKGSNLFVYSV